MHTVIARRTPVELGLYFNDGSLICSTNLLTYVYQTRDIQPQNKNDKKKLFLVLHMFGHKMTNSFRLMWYKAAMWAQLLTPYFH